MGKCNSRQGFGLSPLAGMQIANIGLLQPCIVCEGGAAESAWHDLVKG